MPHSSRYPYKTVRKHSGKYLERHSTNIRQPFQDRCLYIYDNVLSWTQLPPVHALETLFPGSHAHVFELHNAINL